MLSSALLMTAAGIALGVAWPLALAASLGLAMSSTAIGLAIVAERNVQASAAGQGVLVVGAYQRSEQIATRYTSAGPAAGSPPLLPVRQGPDMSAATDDNPSLRSLRVAGNASGMVLRGAGTSFAAPQAARSITTGGAYKLPPTEDPARLGDVRLPP